MACACCCLRPGFRQSRLVGSRHYFNSFLSDRVRQREDRQIQRDQHERHEDAHEDHDGRLDQDSVAVILVLTSSS